jgi:predicted DNA-binding transcriptional regulator YafY
MGRNSELIRQWTLLRRLATHRNNHIPALAQELNVNPRTIRRDLDALQAAGFPIYDEDGNGGKCWRVNEEKLLDKLSRNALTLPELCALYFSRALLQGMAAPQSLGDLQSALDKLQRVLPPAMKKFLDRLPQVITAKPVAGRRRAAQANDVLGRLLEATMSDRVVTMRYHSNQSGREKEYTVHPYRVVYAQNALYLQAFVPAYTEFRTFLLDRIRRLSVEQHSFDRLAELSVDPFNKSLGVHTGPTMKVRLQFAPQVASFVKERTWHESQQLKDRPDGSLVVTMTVSDDYALRQWILGFGRLVRVLAPASLVEWALDELDEARRQYATGGFPVVDSDLQPSLPFLFGQLVSA